MDSSYSTEIINDLRSHKLQALSERSKTASQEIQDPFPMRLCLVGGKYDEFRQTDGDDREFMGRALRATAHVLGASLHYHSAKDAQLLRKTKEMLSNYGFKGQSV